MQLSLMQRSALKHKYIMFQQGHTKFIMDVWFFIRVACATTLALTMSRRGLKKKSLDFGGATAAFIVGFLALASSWRCGISLLVFYFSSSKVTKIGSRRKQQLEGEANIHANTACCPRVDLAFHADEFREGGQRNACQVYTNSLPAVAAAVCVCLLAFLETGLTAEKLSLDFSDDPLHASLCCICIL